LSNTATGTAAISSPIMLGTGLLSAVMLGLVHILLKQYSSMCNKFRHNQELTNEINERKRTEEELRQNRSQLFAEVTLKIRQSLQIEEI